MFEGAVEDNVRLTPPVRPHSRLPQLSRKFSSFPAKNSNWDTTWIICFQEIEFPLRSALVHLAGNFTSSGENPQFFQIAWYPKLVSSGLGAKQTSR